MDGSNKKARNILIVGYCPQAVDAAYKFCRDTFNDLSFIQTISLSPDLSSDLGLPLTNILFDSPFGPLAKELKLTDDIVIFYVNNPKLDGNVELQPENIVSYFASTDQYIQSKYDSLVKSLMTSNEIKSIPEYQAKLGSRKSLLRTEFSAWCKKYCGYSSLSTEEHALGWKRYAKAKDYLFYSIEYFENDRNFTNLYGFVFQSTINFLKSRKRKIDEDRYLVLKEGIDKKSSLNLKEKISRKIKVIFANSPMGYGDYLQRMERMYNLLLNIGGSFSFHQTNYLNPHVKDLDFSEYVNIDLPIHEMEISSESRTLEFEEFFYLLANGLLDEVSNEGHQVYLHKAYRTLNYVFESASANSFYSKVSFSNKVELQPNQSESFRVVFHLRRHDTALSMIRDKVHSAIVDRMGVDRPLLTVEFCEKITKTFLEQNKIKVKNIKVSIISDGYLGLIERYEKLCFFNKLEVEPSFHEYLNQLENELLHPELSLRNTTIDEVCIGRGKEKTILSLGLISNADLVITSSGFAKVLAEIATKPCINGFDAMKFKDNEVKFSEICKGATTL
ncbi:hypothetical protein EXU34_18105 [Alteromonas sp. ZYF713]|nr:hypothetical protein [Alteromonas sp. ZYF713]